LMLAQGERQVGVDLPHVKPLVAALVDGVVDPAEVLGGDPFS
jgi:hypothetical protein